MKIYWAIVLTTATMLSAVGLVSTGAWLISSAALMPPIMVLQVAIVAVRFFGISRGVFRWSERVVSHEVALSGTTALRVELWKAAARLGPVGVWRLRSSDTLDRLTSDSDLLQDEITRVRVPFAAAGLSAVLLVVLQFLILPLAGVVFALSFVISGFLIPKLTFRIENQIAQDAITARNQVNNSVYTAITSASQLRALDQTDSHISKLKLLEDDRIKIESRSSRWAGISSALNGLSSGTAVFIGLIAAVTAFSQGGLSGQMVAVVALLPWASAEIVGTFSLATTAAGRTKVARQRIDSFIQLPNNLEITEEIVLQEPEKLQLRNVSLSWGKNEVVQNLILEVARGNFVGLIGASGTGKSTVINAILRLISYKGEISIDGVEISRIKNFEHVVSAVLQSTYVFNTTVRENLKIANGEATDEKLLQVISDVELNQWFNSLPAGLDSIIGDTTRQLSGGETQRIGIARAILSEAAFILLDEPTEHLDADTAASIWNLIERVFKDCGVLVVTHEPKLWQKLSSTVSLV